MNIINLASQIMDTMATFLNFMTYDDLKWISNHQTIMSKKLLLLGDYHIHQTRIPDCRYVAEQVLKTIKEHNVDYFIQMGDLLDDHRKVEESAYNFTCEFLENLLENEHLKILILAGNHDFRNNQIYCQPEHFLNPFKKWSRVTIVDQPQEVTIGSHKIALMPFVPEGRYHEARTQFLGEDLNYTFFFSHQGFRGGKLDNGDIFKGKDVWYENYPMQITGHFHTPHIVAPNLRYIGSALPLKHGEEDNKIMLLIELYDMERSPNINEEGGYKMNEIPLKALSIFQTLTIDIKNDYELISNPKTRWILTNGTQSELLAYHQEHRNILHDRVQYVPYERKDKVMISNDIKVNFFEELRQRLNKPLRKLLKRYVENLELESGFTRLRLEIPRRKLLLRIDHFMSLDGLIIPIHNGINKLIGENGSGKSTVMRALEWLLYGGNAPSHNQDVKKRATKVILEAKGQWLITRVSSPKILKIENNNGTDVSVYENETAQAIINMSLGSKAVWEATSYLQQKHIGFFFEATEREKRELLSTIFDEDELVTILHKKLIEDEKATKNTYLKIKNEFESKSEVLSQFLQKPQKPLHEEIILEEGPPFPEKPTFGDLSYLLEKKEKPLEPVYQELPSFELNYENDPEEPIYQKEEFVKPTEPIYEKFVPSERLDISSLKEPIRPKGEPKPPCVTRERVLHNEYLKKELAERLDQLDNIPELPDKCFKYSLERLSGLIKLEEREFETIERAHQNELKKEKYRKVYQREPSADLIHILLSGCETHCPSCQKRLILDDSNLSLAPEGWKENENAQQEKKLLSQIDFDLKRPLLDLEEARERMEMTRILEMYPLELIQKATQVQSIKGEIKKLKKEIDPNISPGVFEDYDSDLENYKKELIIYEEKLRVYHDLRNEEKEKLSLWDIEQEKAKTSIKEKNQELKRIYLQKLEDYEKLCQSIRDRNRTLRKEYETRLKIWKEEQRQKYEVKRKHHEAILSQNDQLRKHWILEVEKWEDEIDANQERYQSEKEKRTISYQKEYEQALRIQEERKQQYEKDLQRQIKEKEAYRKAKENWRNATLQMGELEENVVEKKELYHNLKELLYLFRQTQSEILEQKLQQWNLYFDQLLKRCFDDISAEIKTEKEAKHGTIDKISFDIVLNGIRRNDIKSASGGETDVFSIAFLLATQRLISNSFKIILLDESLSQISVKRVQERITNILTDYLSYPGTFCLVASHDETLFAEENVIPM